MTGAYLKMVELSQAGFFCSQILLIIGLEALGRDNPDVVRAMAGLNGGLGFCGKTCGALTGGACLIGLYAGKGTVEETEHNYLIDMVGQLVDWFEAEVKEQYGGIDCEAILENNPANRMARCPQLVLKTLGKVEEILVANGYDLAGRLNY